METLFQEYEEVAPILRIGDFGLVKYKKQDKKKRGITNPRQVFIKDIQEIMEQENGGKMSKEEVKLLCMKLSHIPTEDLPFMKSEGISYRRRTGKPFGRYIFGSIKPKKV